MSLSNNLKLGVLFLISGPSGSGKTSLIKILLENDSKLNLSVSYTTRKPRSNEINGQNYFFIDSTEFKHKIKNNNFIEYAQVFDHYYGTDEQQVLSKLSHGDDLLLEIDWQGAQQVRQSNFDYKYKLKLISIYILPPSKAVLLKRLEHRAQDSNVEINKRFKQAQADMSHCAEYDYIIINDNFDLAVKQLEEIVNSARLSSVVQLNKNAVLLQSLLHNG